MRGLAILTLLVASPATAQLADRASNDMVRFTSDGSERFLPAPPVPATAIVRAGAWGRCVVAASPDASRAYLATRVAEPSLQPVFQHCLRATGDFLFSGRGDIRRAALSDALARR